MHSTTMSVATRKRKAKAGGRTEYLVLIKQWIHQGFTYLDKTEMLYRIVWEMLPATLLAWLLITYSSLNPVHGILLSVFIVHTLNWILNFNFWTCITFTFPGVKNPGNEATIKYLRQMQSRMLRHQCIGGCMLYGSISRKAWHDKSDLDMRILRKPGRLNGFKAYLVVFTERIRAVFAMQPLDLYLADSTRFLKKMRKDEFPVFLKNDDERLHQLYQTKETTDFNAMSHLNQ